MAMAPLKVQLGPAAEQNSANKLRVTGTYA